jgi:hypothetical protein
MEKAAAYAICAFIVGFGVWILIALCFLGKSFFKRLGLDVPDFQRRQDDPFQAHCFVLAGMR